jgi:hypothetical protein
VKSVEERIAEGMAVLVLIFTVAYFVGHIIAALLNGAFARAVAR